MLSLSACRKSLNNKFLHAVRLREMELNFVFLRVVTVQYQVATKQSTGLFFPNHRFGATVSCALHNSLRAKNEKRLKKLGLDVQSFFNPSVCDKSHPPPFAQGRQNKVYLIIFWRGSDHFIDSLKGLADAKPF